jgi:hypothetical protein
MSLEGRAAERNAAMATLLPQWPPPLDGLLIRNYPSAGGRAAETA